MNSGVLPENVDNSHDNIPNKSINDSIFNRECQSTLVHTRKYLRREIKRGPFVFLGEDFEGLKVPYILIF